MAKGGSSQPTQTTTYTPDPHVAELLDLAMPGIRQFAATVPKRYEGSPVAGFTAPQQQGQQMALDAATGAQTQLAQTGAGANQFLLSDIWNPATNPNLQNAVDAAVRPITQNYLNVVKPGIRDQFQQAGQTFGGSRRFATENLGADAYLRNVGDTSSKLVQDQYANNLSAYVKALGLLPQTQAAQITPAVTTSGVGDVQQNQAQRELDARIAGYNYDQLAPFLQSKELFALLNSIPGGSTTSTANMPGKNPWSSALGGAATGASLGTAIMPGVGTVVGAGLGGLLGFL